MTKHAGGAVLVSCIILFTGCPKGGGGDGGTGGGSGGGSNGGGSSGGGSNGGGSAGGTGTGGSSTGGGSGSVTLDQLCTQAFSTECAFFARCGGVSSTTSCEAIIASRTPGPCDATVLGHLDAGTVKFDPAAASNCLGSFATLACSGFAVSTPGACNMIFVGQVPVGSACSDSSECAPPAYCMGGVSQCGGTCTAKIAVGQPVMEEEQCVDGATPLDGVCVIGTLQQGQSCAAPDGGFTQLPCAQPAYCSLFFNDDGGYANVCVDATAKQGEPCNDRDAGVLGCAGFAYCDNAGLCQPLIGPNAACDDTNFGSQCMGDLWCNVGLAQAVCQPFSHTGGPCAYDGACVDSDICDGGLQINPDGGPWPLGACEPVPGVGQGCNDICAAGLVCDALQGKCLAPTTPDGQPCTSAAECLSGQCTFSEDAGAQVCGGCR